MKSKTDKDQIENNENAEREMLDKERCSFLYDVRQKKLDIINMFDDVMGICRSLVDAAKKDVTSVSAAMLAQILRLMNQTSGIMKMAEELREEIDEAIERQEDEDEMTPEEREMWESFQEDHGEFLEDPLICDENPKSQSFKQEFNKSY